MQCHYYNNTIMINTSTPARFTSFEKALLVRAQLATLPHRASLASGRYER